MDATQIAGLNCLRLMNETTAGKWLLTEIFFYLLSLRGCEILKPYGFLFHILLGTLTTSVTVFLGMLSHMKSLLDKFFFCIFIALWYLIACFLGKELHLLRAWSIALV